MDEKRLCHVVKLGNFCLHSSSFDMTLEQVEQVSTKDRENDPASPYYYVWIKCRKLLGTVYYELRYCYTSPYDFSIEQLIVANTLTGKCTSVEGYVLRLPIWLENGVAYADPPNPIPLQEVEGFYEGGFGPVCVDVDPIVSTGTFIVKDPLVEEPLMAKVNGYFIGDEYYDARPFLEDPVVKYPDIQDISDIKKEPVMTHGGNPTLNEIQNEFTRVCMICHKDYRGAHATYCPSCERKCIEIELKRDERIRKIVKEELNNQQKVPTPASYDKGVEVCLAHIPVNILDRVRAMFPEIEYGLRFRKI